MESERVRIVFGSTSFALCVAYFVLREIIPTTDIYPLPGMAAFVGIVGLVILGFAFLSYLIRRFDNPPPPPYVQYRCLERGGDGSYEACQEFLRELQEVFGADYSEHLESGIRPDLDKEKGYWNVKMFGQNFFVMRYRGVGLCIWGPQPPEDIAGFLRVVEHFGAREYVSWRQRISGVFSRHHPQT